MLLSAEGWNIRFVMKHLLVGSTGSPASWMDGIAIGLGILDLTVLVAKGMPPLPWPLVATRAQVPTQPVAQPSASHTLNFES
jgi:hypothetical protein